MPLSLTTRTALTAGIMAAAIALGLGALSYRATRQLVSDHLQAVLDRAADALAARVAGNLNALADSLASPATNTLVGNALVDDLGRDVYLSGFLTGFGASQGMDVSVQVTNFLGVPISSNPGRSFVTVPKDRVAAAIERNRMDAWIARTPGGLAGVVVRPVIYANTGLPEGALIYQFDLADVLRHADQAMYLAKQLGRGRYQIFDVEQDRRASAQLELLARFQEALVRDQLLLAYQPKVDMRRGTVFGAEALVRWRHPSRGLLLPGQFLPLIRGHALQQLDWWVLEHATVQLARWSAAGLQLDMSVNLGADTIQHPDFVPRLRALLAAHPQVWPGTLELEILETDALDDLDRVAAVIEHCAELGVSFALDDFGTGYSSLTYCRRLPTRVLKIDQTFVRNMLQDSEDLNIVEGVIGLANAFDRTVIAEGVESDDHGTLLLRLGCDRAQGYGIARPMPAEELPGWVAAYRPPSIWGIAAATHWSLDDMPLLTVEAEHQAWIERIAEVLRGAETAVLPTGDARDCRFGHWYQHTGARRYAHLDSFRTLAPVHTRAHALGAELLELAQVDRAAALARLPELLELRDDLLVRLRALQFEVIASGARAGAEPPPLAVVRA